MRFALTVALTLALVAPTAAQDDDESDETREARLVACVFFMLDKMEAASRYVELAEEIVETIGRPLAPRGELVDLLERTVQTAEKLLSVPCDEQDEEAK